jgi:uncharacterized repeat protein (TIGR04076 family)
MAREFQLYDLRVTVHSIEGRPVCGLKTGDYFEIVNSSQLRIPDGKFFCIYALNAVLPLLPAKQRDLDKNDWLERDIYVSCPDPEERLILRIDRLRKITLDSDDLT